MNFPIRSVVAIGLAVALTACSATTVQSPSQQVSTPNIDQMYCLAVSDLAAAVMDARQGGVSVIDLVERTSEAANDDVKGIYVQMIRDAYSFDVYKDPATQKMAINSFGHTWYRTCMTDAFLK